MAAPERSLNCSCCRWAFWILRATDEIFGRDVGRERLAAPRLADEAAFVTVALRLALSREPWLRLTFARVFSLRLLTVRLPLEEAEAVDREVPRSALLSTPFLRAARDFVPRLKAAFAPCLSSRTKARIKSFFRMECQPRIPRFLAI